MRLPSDVRVAGMFRNSRHQMPGGDGRQSGAALHPKMASYQVNGARLGWLLLLPEERTVEIWPAADGGGQSGLRRLEETEVLEAGAAIQGLRLDLAQIWNI